MPKLKDTEEQARAKEIMSIIEKYKVIRGYDNNDIARVITMTRQTYYSRRKKPDTFTVAELAGICKALKIPMEERGKMLV